MKHRDVTIVLVDDDRVDTMAIRRSFRELRIGNPIVEARNGIEALDRLRGENGQEKVTQPCLVLLDLNMPRMGGIEFLKELRDDPALHRTLVFVMTTSASVEDRINAYDKHVAGYVLKHRPGESFLESVRMLENYWQKVSFPV